QGNDMVGNRTRLKVVKNKVAPPFKQAVVDIMYGEGISKEGEVLDIGSDLDIVQKSGAWYSYNDERLVQGRENAKQFLQENKKRIKKSWLKYRNLSATTFIWMNQKKTMHRRKLNKKAWMCKK